jgi:WD40 repeat protein
MISTLTGSGAGPIAAYLATGRFTVRRLNVFSTRKNILAPAAVATQPTDAPGSVFAVAWSDGYLAASSSNSLLFYSRSGSALTQETVPSNITTISQDGDAAISADGEYVAYATGLLTAGSLGRIYHNNAGTLTNLTSIGDLTNSSRACAVSSDGTYVAFLGGTSPTFLRIKVRSGSGPTATYSDMTLADQPASGVTGGSGLAGLAFSPDDVYLAVSPTNQANQTVYKFDSGTSVYEKLASPFTGTAPDNSVRGCAFDSAGSVLAIATAAKTFFYIRTGDAFAHAATISVSGDGQRGSFHPSGSFYITGGGRIYRKGATAASWTFVTSVTAVNCAAFSPYV